MKIYPCEECGFTKIHIELNKSPVMIVCPACLHQTAGSSLNEATKNWNGDIEQKPPLIEPVYDSTDPVQDLPPSIKPTDLDDYLWMNKRQYLRRLLDILENEKD